LELAFIIAERLADGRIKRDAVSPLARFRSIDL
jgi:3-deoxy-7-phosphoheptulonate synthase